MEITPLEWILGRVMKDVDGGGAEVSVAEPVVGVGRVELDELVDVALFHLEE